MKSHDFIIPLLGLCDILKKFNTGIYIEGTIHYDRRIIYKNYIRGGFIFDLISYASCLSGIFF